MRGGAAGFLRSRMRARSCASWSRCRRRPATRARSTAASRSAQHGGLAVHAAAGADDCVGAGHELAAVEGLAAPEESAEAGGLQVGGLGPRARQEDRRDRRARQALQEQRKQRAGEAVVEGHVGGRPDHHDRARRVDAGAPTGASGRPALSTVLRRCRQVHR